MVTKDMEEYKWHELNVGFVIDEPGNAKLYKTGAWRSQRPVFDYEKCKKCYLCWLFCPEAAIYQMENGYFNVNLEYCKGCGICKEECPFDAIKMEEEKR